MTQLVGLVEKAQFEAETWEENLRRAQAHNNLIETKRLRDASDVHQYKRNIKSDIKINKTKIGDGTRANHLEQAMLSMVQDQDEDNFNKGGHLVTEGSVDGVRARNHKHGAKSGNNNNNNMVSL